jgi:2,3-bisphosphoglycerate-dependent phosphoglycerate mutase
MTCTLYFIRHAQSHPSIKKHYSQWPLSEKGQTQAQHLPQVLKDLGFTKLYSSPYLRCVETIRPFADSHGFEIEFVQELEERVMAKCLLTNFSEVWEKSWDDFHYALPECESSHQAQQRFIQAIRNIASNHFGETIGVSTHGNVIGLFLNHLEPSFFRCETENLRNPDVIRIEFRDDQFVWDRTFDIPELALVATDHKSVPYDYSID